jgi:hypothetical protein
MELPGKRKGIAVALNNRIIPLSGRKLLSTTTIQF